MIENILNQNYPVNVELLHVTGVFTDKKAVLGWFWLFCVISQL